LASVMRLFGFFSSKTDVVQEVFSIWENF